MANSKAIKKDQHEINQLETAIAILNTLDSETEDAIERAMSWEGVIGYGATGISKWLGDAIHILKNDWDEDDYEASTKKSEKVGKMAKNKAIRKETEHIALTEEGMDIKFSFIAEGSKSKNETVSFEVYAEPPGTGILVNCGRFKVSIADIVDPMMPLIVEKAKSEVTDVIEEFNRLYAERGLDFSYTYDASAKKSMDKSKYSDIHKRLAKLGGFTKDEEEIEIDDDDVVEIEEEDGQKVVEIESEKDHEKEVENGEESDDDNLNECNRNVKSKKTSKGMRTSKKRMKMKKGEDMPEDADDFKEDNQKGSGSAGRDMPEDADDNQNDNDAGTGNAGSELPEDANDQQDIKESARKARLARMRRSANKSVNRPPVKKFSVTNGGQPNQESYNQRYSQAPMVREAIDGHISSRANKSFDEIAMMNERIANIQKAKRNPSGNNGVPKRLH